MLIAPFRKAYIYVKTRYTPATLPIDSTPLITWYSNSASWSIPTGYGRIQFWILEPDSKNWQPSLENSRKLQKSFIAVSITFAICYPIVTYFAKALRSHSPLGACLYVFKSFMLWSLSSTTRPQFPLLRVRSRIPHPTQTPLK